MSDDYDYMFKMCIVGDAGGGREDFVKLFTKGFFTEDYKKVIGVDFHVKTITVDTEERGPLRIKLQIWDIGWDIGEGGLEQFSSNRPMYLIGALGISIIFDLSDRMSFIHLDDWIKLIKENLYRRKKKKKKEIPILLVGNKTDPEKFAVSPKELDEFIRKYKTPYIETSTITKEGIFDSFYCIASLMLGVDIHSEYFLSEKIIYRPSVTPVSTTPSTPKLTPKDLSNLSQKVIFDKLITLEKKINGIKIQEAKPSKLIELKERELKLREREIELKEKQLTKDSAVDDLHVKKTITVFVSYATKDAQLFKIKEIAENLNNKKGIEKVLFYEGESYDNFVKYMNDNLGTCDIMLLFCSPNALKSKFVEKEWTAADALGKPILPVFIKSEHIPPLLKSRLGVEFDAFNLQKTINEIYDITLKKVKRRIIDIKDLKTDF